MHGVVVDLVFGIALLALGLYLFAQRHTRIAIARERGLGIKSPVVHNAIAAACVLFGILSIATAFA
jgi:hypothetical protein